MHDNKLEVPYECESDDNEDGEVNNTINDEFEGVLTQVREDSLRQESALKRGNKRSAGNIYKFPQQVKHGKLNHGNMDSIVRKRKSDREILADIENLTNCCSKGGERGCIIKMFTSDGSTDYTRAIQYLREVQVCSNLYCAY